MRAPGLVWVGVVLLLFTAAAVSCPVGAAAQLESASCGSPLGPEAERGANHVLQAAADPEYDLIDTVRMSGAQRSGETVLYFGGHLVLVAEVKVDKDSNFTWAVFVRFHSNETGWNSSQIWLSSPDTTVAYPSGVHIRPTAAVWRDRLYVAWDSAGSQQGAPADRLLLMRSVDRNGMADTTRVASDTDPTRSNQHPYLLPLADRLVLAYSTAAGESDPSENHIVVRSFDGSSFAPSEVLSAPDDGWTDGLPLVAGDPAGHLYALWSSSNLLGNGARLLFSRDNMSNWSAPAILADLGLSATGAPAGAFFNGRFIAAYATQNLADVDGPDVEIFWRSLEPATGEWSAASSANPQPSNGDDVGPSFALIGGALYIGWSTNEDFYYSHGSDTDPVYRVFNGTGLGPVVELSVSDDRATDGTPHFVEVGDHLYAHWMWTPPADPGTPRGDSREAIRLANRPPQWYDGLRASYSIRSVSENGSSELFVKVENATGAPATGVFVVRARDGSTHRLEPTADGYVGWAPVEPDTPDLEVLACGKPLPLTYLAPPVAQPPRFLSLGGPVAFAGLMAAAASVRRRLRS